MKKAFIILILNLFVFNNVFAKQISGMGYGKNGKEARKEAISDLSQNIQVEIKSEFTSFKSVTDGKLKENTSNIIHLKSDLPMIGVKYDITRFKEKVLVEAILNYKNKTLYENELLRIQKSIDTNLYLVEKKKGSSDKAALLEEILTSIDQFEKYRIVAQFLGSTNPFELAVSTAEIKTQLDNIESKADTLDLGVRKIAKSIKKKKIFIHPPTTQNSSEITEFASAVKDALSTYLNTVESPQKAKYFLSGEYRILKKRLEITYRLTDNVQNTIRTAVTSFLPQAYEEYEIKPKTVDFDRLVRTGAILSSELRADMTTSFGKRDILLKKGDSFKLLVKINKPGYFYMVGHSLKNKHKYSYIVDFYEGEGNRKFIYRVSADDANKWISLGEFEVIEPFGVETLQMIASTEDLVEKVPGHYYDINTMLYKIHSKPSKALAKIRAFIRKDRLDNKEKAPPVTEAIIVLTTMER